MTRQSGPRNICLSLLSLRSNPTQGSDWSDWGVRQLSTNEAVGGAVASRKSQPLSPTNITHTLVTAIPSSVQTLEMGHQERNKVDNKTVPDRN